MVLKLILKCSFTRVNCVFLRNFNNLLDAEDFKQGLFWQLAPSSLIL